MLEMVTEEASRYPLPVKLATESGEASAESTNALFTIEGSSGSLTVALTKACVSGSVDVPPPLTHLPLKLSRKFEISIGKLPIEIGRIPCKLIKAEPSDRGT